MKLTLIASAFALALSAPALATDAHKKHDKHAHQHKADCGHKSEQHGDHTDYEHDGHHHKDHKGHVDECTGPEADKS